MPQHHCRYNCSLKRRFSPFNTCVDSSPLLHVICSVSGMQHGSSPGSGNVRRGVTVLASSVDVCCVLDDRPHDIHMPVLIGVVKRNLPAVRSNMTSEKTGDEPSCGSSERLLSASAPTTPTAPPYPHSTPGSTLQAGVFRCLMGGGIHVRPALDHHSCEVYIPTLSTQAEGGMFYLHSTRHFPLGQPGMQHSFVI